MLKKDLLPNNKYVYKNLIIFCEHVITDGGYETDVIYPIGKTDGTILTPEEEDAFYFTNDFKTMIFEKYDD